MTKSSKYGNGITNPVKQVAVALAHPQSEGAFTVWGEGGIGLLMQRVRREHQDHPFADPVTQADLAHLLDRFAGWPLPAELRDILILELCGKRKGRPGPKITQSDWDHIQDVLLVLRYEQGLLRSKTLRLYLQLRESKQTRSAKPYIIPTARGRACRYVRNRLPRFRDMTDASIANLVSLQRANILALERQQAEREKSSLNSRQE